MMAAQDFEGFAVEDGDDGAEKSVAHPCGTQVVRKPIVSS